MRNLPIAVVTVSVFAACGEPVAPIFSSTTQARVRFANATSDVVSLNFTVNNQAGPQSVPFGALSSCQTFSAGALTVAATPAGSTSSFGASLSQTLAAGGRHAVVATGSALEPQFLFLTDATSTPAAGRARLRIVNAVADTTGADIFVTAPAAALGTATAPGVLFNTATSFLDLAAGQTQIRFTTAGTQTVTFTGAPFSLNAGETVTVVVAPGTAPDTFRSFTLRPC